MSTTGLGFTGLAIGALIGFALSYIWDRQLKDPFKSPEQQLYKACAGGIIFSIGESTLKREATGYDANLLIRLKASSGMPGLLSLVTFTG
jgi:hypothetical protein